MEGSRGVVLLPGAGLGSWVWRDLVPLLEVPSLAVDYPGRDLDPKARHQLRLQDYADHVAAQVSSWDEADRVVVVAHSLGGVVGLSVAQTLGDRVVAFAGVSAVIPRDGGSFLSCLPWSKRVPLGVLLRIVGTRPPEATIRRGLANDLPREVGDELVERFAPESRRVYSDPVGAPVPEVPTLYVRCANDEELDVALQDRIIGNLDGADVVTLDSGHLPMLSRPSELAAAIRELVSKPV